MQLSPQDEVLGYVGLNMHREDTEPFRADVETLPVSLSHRICEIARQLLARLEKEAR